MSLLSSPRAGLWTDHSDHHSYQTLQRESWSQAQWFKVCITVSLTLATPYITRILISSFLLVKMHLFPATTEDNTTGDETQPLLKYPTPEVTKSGREVFRKFVSGAFGKNSQWQSRHRFFWFFVVGSLFFAFYAQVIVGLVLTDSVATNRVGLLDSHNCGLWEYDNEKAGEEQASRADMLMVERERRAASYAQDCYDHGVDKHGKAMRCDFFYNSTISYRVLDDKCPFYNTAVCTEGYQSGAAVTFDTGVVDSDVLGINYESTYKFRRKTTCAPLTSTTPFVRHFTNKVRNEAGYKYYYGSLYDTTNCSEEVHAPPPVIQDYTMEITGHPFTWQAPVYRLDPYATSLLDPTCDFYQPTADLQAPGLLPDRTKTLTLLFVTALHILYTKRSNDPVFPADKPYRFPGDELDYYYNSEPKARAFACIDETLFCAPSGSPCWHAADPVSSERIDSSAYWFMKYSLQKSNIYDSIKLRLGGGLLAQQRVGQSRSRPLPDNHWQLEAEQLFKTSLARAQFDAWSIASAEDHDNPTYTDTIPTEAQGQMCNLFKFQTSRYINVRIWPFVCLMLVLPTVLVLSIQTKTYLHLWHSLLCRLKHSNSAIVKQSLNTATSVDVPMATKVPDQRVLNVPSANNNDNESMISATSTNGLTNLRTGSLTIAVEPESASVSAGPPSVHARVAPSPSRSSDPPESRVEINSAVMEAPVVQVSRDKIGGEENLTTSYGSITSTSRVSQETGRSRPATAQRGDEDAGELLLIHSIVLGPFTFVKWLNSKRRRPLVDQNVA